MGLLLYDRFLWADHWIHLRGGDVVKKKKKFNKEFAQEFSDALADNEEHMGEGAAYLVTCEQMGVDPDDGYSLLAELA